MKGFVDFWKGYVNFKDRTTRKDFWMAMLFIIIIGAIIGMIFPGKTVDYQGIKIVQNSIVSIIWSLITFLPSLALEIRRLHDINKSGWWVLIALIQIIGAIVLIVFFCQKSVTENNEYGEQL